MHGQVCNLQALCFTILQST